MTSLDLVSSLRKTRDRQSYGQSECLDAFFVPTSILKADSYLEYVALSEFHAMCVVWNKDTTSPHSRCKQVVMVAALIMKIEIAL